MRRSLLLAVVALFAGACTDAPTAPEPSLAPAAAGDVQLASRSHDDSRVIPDQYIVVFDRRVRDVPGQARGLTAQAGGELLHVYEHALTGFAARLPEAAVQGIRRNPNVAYVEPDGVVTAIGSGTQSSPPSWGLDRVDERDLPLDALYDYGASGEDVRAYILDTGIRTSHDDFGGRAVVGIDVMGDGQNGEDCNGHGTHVAGTVGGASYGVAKSATLVAVRVLDCGGSGSYSGVIAGIDWVTANANLPAVANMSLGGGSSTAVNEAVDNSVAAGVFYAVAAGNGHWLFGWPEDACTKSPAGAARAYTVGATNSNDGEASFSNYGSCVNLLAPGVSITAPWIGSDTDTNTISGTSMATPHVAGAAAAYLEANPGANPVQVADALSSGATAGRIALHSSSSSGGTPNLLLYTGVAGDGGGGGGGGNAAPTASFTSDCTEFTCDFDGSGSFDDGSITGYAWDVDGDGDTDHVGATVDDHVYPEAGTYTVTLTVTDDLGETGSSSQNVSVGPNTPPNAAFLEACSDLSCAFDGGTYSSDPDGTIVSYVWDYGDGTGDTGGIVSTTYAEPGTYTVVLTVTDDGGATGTSSRNVTVEAAPEPPSAGSIELSASGYKVRGRHMVDLAWTGATSTNVDVFRGGSLLTTTANDGAYTDATNNRGNGSYTYRVCEAGTDTCSSEATVTF